MIATSRRMAAALELIIIPIVLMVTIAVLRIAKDFSMSAIILGGAIVGMAIGGLIGLARFAWRLDKDEGVDVAPHDRPAPDKEEFAPEAEGDTGDSPDDDTNQESLSQWSPLAPTPTGKPDEQPGSQTS